MLVVVGLLRLPKDGQPWYTYDVVSAGMLLAASCSHTLPSVYHLYISFCPWDLSCMRLKLTCVWQPPCRDSTGMAEGAHIVLSRSIRKVCRLHVYRYFGDSCKDFCSSPAMVWHSASLSNCLTHGGLVYPACACQLKQQHGALIRKGCVSFSTDNLIQCCT